ncbi:MAG: hypothetical protein R3E12_00480 [Candidatus Eisenbacteria bacterium]
MNIVANNSLGTQANRLLDRLGLPDAFGDAIPARSPTSRPATSPVPSATSSISTPV